jgi:hypothetical protein
MAPLVFGDELSIELSLSVCFLRVVLLAASGATALLSSFIVDAALLELAGPCFAARDVDDATLLRFGRGIVGAVA